MAAHCRHDERLSLSCFDKIDDRFGDDRHIGDAAAAGCNRNAQARLDLSGNLRLGQLGKNDLGQILRQNRRFGKTLPGPEHAGNFYALQ